MTADDVRARFEAWATFNGECPDAVSRANNGDYVVTATHMYWIAWQAAHADLSGEVRELVEGYRSLYRAYVNTLEVARDRIRELGGQCDPVDVMERGDPALSLARERLAKFTQEKP